jgi:hypothetical protein
LSQIRKRADNGHLTNDRGRKDMENIRILVIEDDKIDQAAFKRFIKDENPPYDCTIAALFQRLKGL